MLPQRAKEYPQATRTPRAIDAMATAQQHLFSKRTFDWLNELQANNNKAWFEEHRSRYEDDVRAPALAYIEAMAPVLRRISPHFTAIAKKTGGSLMRVHRDMRFAKDGQRYKTNIGIQFRHERGRDVHAPGFYGSTPSWR